MIKGILFDIGGVLYVANEPIPGAREIIQELRENYQMRFLTNTTRKPPAKVYQKLKSLGFDIKESELFTALGAAKKVVEKADAKALTILTDEAEEFFGQLCGFDTKSKFVVVGDAGENFNYERLNSAFRALINGATLIAAAKNRYFKDSDGELSMDAGGFVEALEYASGVKAKVIGKPSKEFFELAVESMNLNPEEVLMVGDDIESDILGAQNANIKAVLVKSGKFRESDLKKGIKPDFVIESVSNLKDVLEKF
jgi:HAD superfamily hydrolase (TIGR01458 family)